MALPEAPEDFVRSTFVLPLLDPASGFFVDAIFSVSPYEREALSRSITVRIGGTDVRFASFEDTLIHKIVAGRPRDWEDIRGMLRRSGSWDRAYVRRWLLEFDTAQGGGRAPELDRLDREIGPSRPTR